MLTDLYQHETDPVADARGILIDAVERYAPSHVFGLFSGGNDSACACHAAASILGERFTAAIHINTQTGIAETREHVQRVAETQGWPLIEYQPPLPRWGNAGETAYQAIVRRYGFPGPAQHGTVYRLLKERCVRRLIREHRRGPTDRILLVTGARLAESRIRMGRVDTAVREGVRVWVAPILRWHEWDKAAYMRANGLPPNPVAEVLGISGECCCGAFACPGEFARLERHFPAKAAEITRDEEMARMAGVPSMWGERPPERAAVEEGPGLFGLCWSCGTKAERRERRTA